MGGQANRAGGTRRVGPQRTTRGGGITKARPNLRTDRDGDVSMGAPAGGPKPPSGPSGRGNRGRGTAGATRGSRQSSRLAQNLNKYIADGTPHGPKSHYNNNKTTLKILGLKNSKAATNPDGGVKSLLEFLERKADKEKKVVLGRGVLDGDYVWVKANKDDLPSILHLNGYTYAGAPITIEETTEPFPNPASKVSRDAADTRQKLLAVLAKRYNPAQKLLDLSALGTDDILGSLGTFGSQSLAEKSFKALMHLAGAEYRTAEEKKEAIQAVSLANNEIQDVDQVFTLAYSLPQLRRLDLSGNKIEHLSKLSKWKHEFRYLEELHLASNPLTTQPNWASEITQWYPSLQILDGSQVRTPQQAAENLKLMTPQPLPQLPSNLRDGDLNVGSAFLRSFFQKFDYERHAVVTEYYDSESSFCLTAIPAPGRELPWKAYLKYSRNIMKLGTRTPALVQRLFTGVNFIGEVFRALPATRHPTLDQPELWLIDCHTFPNGADPLGQGGSAMGLIINVHGQFEEADASENLYGTRTFSRNFVLGPSKPGAVHPYRVVSDQLTLHDWKPQAAIAEPTPLTNTVVAIPAAPVVPVVPVAPPVPVALGQIGLDDATKAQMVAELSRRTGMTGEYSLLCLEGMANWNFDLALQSFEAQKANLPPTAFATTP
ncbi:putative mRNA export factor mex67 [Podospora australis]|uniref:mRNA export factor MEX67 n=1 Tax=Podospora australis TaxID=1536484 RepID=A0AAN7AJK0_9PEZI|nr:putative mRNA export factor mex67 [Podospora australis]